MSPLILPLTSSNATLARVGGKGANLAALTRAGFMVPPGFLVTTAAYQAFVVANDIAPQILSLARGVVPDDPVALDQTSEQIRALFEQGHMPHDVAEPIVAAYRALPGGAEGAQPVAVRSSATAEDLPGLSFAGQQDTYLNIVGADALLDAVKRCWGSLWTARAIGYRARNNIAPDDVALAVVVQQLIPAEVAGVLFTANPLTGKRDEIVIDASYGLGEAIVSGQVEPDHYVVDPRSWQITGRKLGAKAFAIVPRAAGGTDQVTRGGDQQALPDVQIIELAQVSRRVAAHFGSPQDIEWAWADGQLYLLQSRPITSLYPLPDLPAAPDDPRVYFSFNSVQGVLDPFTPLGSDLLQLLGNGFLRLFKIQRPVQQVIPAAGGRLFIDITDITRLWLAALRRLDPGARQALSQLIDKGQVGLRSPPLAPALWRLLPTLAPFQLRVAIALRTPDFARARALAATDAFLNDARVRSAAARTLTDQLEAIEFDLSRAIPIILPSVGPVVAPGLVLMGTISGWLERWLGLPSSAVFELLRGLPHNVTTEMDLRLWALAHAIGADAAARDTLLRMPVEEQVAAYARDALPATAQRAIKQFLDQYGMRAVAEIDIGRPRWRDDPTPILQIIHGYLQLDDPNQAPDVLFERGAAEAARLAEEWTAQARRTRFGAIRARLLGGAIDRMRRLIGLRESPKFYLISLLGIYRDALLVYAGELVARGALAQVDDIFFLSFEQLRRFARGEGLDLKGLVASQRAEYEHNRSNRRMPRLLLSTGEAFYDGLGEAGTSDLIGDPVSPGVVEGTVRVVHDPRGVRLAPGEILVCPATDPGWTPLFLTAGGLVMEVGGMVTHGSVVAREYGIPAVVGVQAATTRLHTGQRVRVDGTQGRITLLDEAPEPNEQVAATIVE